MKIFRFLSLGLIIAFVLSCDNEEEAPEITISDLVGSWKASSTVFTNNSNPDQFIDLIALGGELRFTMLDNGGVRTWFSIDTISDEWDSQAVITNGNILTLTPVETDRATNTYDFVLDNNTLKLTNSNDSFDFTLSGASEVQATSVSNFDRN